MTERDSENYDALTSMLKSSGAFLKQYRSFTTDKEYTNLVGVTASGLLQDVAAKTYELSPVNQKKHLYSLEVFAAFIIFFCAEKAVKTQHSASDATTAATNIYQRVLTRIKNDLEQTGTSHYVRNLIIGAAGNEMISIFRSEQKWNNKRNDLEVQDAEGNNWISSEAMVKILEGAQERVNHYQRMLNVDKLISSCRMKGILDADELFILCSYYGIGDGYEKLSNQAIAAELGKSDGYVSKQRQLIEKKLLDYIKEDPERSSTFRYLLNH